MLKRFIYLLSIFICSLSSAMAEENYKFSCHGWKGTLIDILPDENNKDKVTMRPINMDLKYKENDLSFVWPKNADWSDEKTVPLKVYESEKLITTSNAVKHKYEKIILTTIFLHDVLYADYHSLFIIFIIIIIHHQNHSSSSLILPNAYNKNTCPTHIIKTHVRI